MADIQQASTFDVAGSSQITDDGDLQEQEAQVHAAEVAELREEHKEEIASLHEQMQVKDAELEQLRAELALLKSKPEED